MTHFLAIDQWALGEIIAVIQNPNLVNCRILCIVCMEVACVLLV
jgi:hypothetical protein